MHGETGCVHVLAYMRGCVLACMCVCVCVGVGVGLLQMCARVHTCVRRALRGHLGEHVEVRTWLPVCVWVCLYVSMCV